MERDNLIQIVTLIIAIVALILALFSVMVPDNEDTDDSENEVPSASITVASTSVEEMESLLFDASGSSDPDGVIVEYTWDFGDGAKDSGMYSNHAYSATNTYAVVLTVIDDKGETATTSTPITVTEKVIPDNLPPVASMFLSATNTDQYEHINCDGSSSTDSDGFIISYLWEFGDGTNSSGIYTNHYYTSPGSYTIKLTVTDNYLEKNSTSVNIIINDPGGPPTNDPPTAEITVDQTIIQEDEPHLFNASGSSDSDGSIVEYSWDFKDGGYGSGIQVDHIFNDFGEYNVTLTVYDNDGASNMDFVIITVEAAAPTGTIEFSKTDPWNYTGGLFSLSDDLLITDAFLYIMDASSGNNETQDPVLTGVPFQVGAGLKLTYTDTNANDEFDTGDDWDIENGEHGDVIRLVFKTGETIAEYVIIVTTPTGALSFTENMPGEYTGGIISLSDQVLISEASLFIIDFSTGLNATQVPIQSGVPVQAGSGMILTYTDSNGNDKLDAGDVWTISNGEAGDVIKLIFIQTGGSIAEYTLS
jgi:PKD repeat protein